MSWSPPRRSALLPGFVLATAVGLLFFATYWLDDLARGHASPPLEPLVEELTGAYGAALQALWLVPFLRRHRLDGPGWPARLPLHLAAALVFSAVHTTLNWWSRELLFPLAGLGDYDYGHLPLRYAMELPKDLLIYGVVGAVVTLLDRSRAARERELRRAAALARGELKHLQAQLQPHFLFNTLNAIAAVMYDDVRAADRMLARLSELLRRTLDASRAHEIPLEEELAILAPYLELSRVRFGERLAIDVAVDDAVRRALVPALVLQPLVENALRHGLHPAPTPARVAVRARRDADDVVLEVEDDGPGFEATANGAPANGAGGTGRGHGIGLANTGERLRWLYGDRGALERGTGAGGGARVTVRLPFHVEPEPALAGAAS